jgi:outer membrane protein assembly factor BamA
VSAEEDVVPAPRGVVLPRLRGAPGVRLSMMALALAGAIVMPGIGRADKSFIPIPEIITDPNEGTTVGFLGVILFLDDKDQIQYMLAPDARYNETKGFFPTLRFFGYPSATRRYSVVLGKSTTRDEDYEVEYTDRGLWDGRGFLLASFLHEKDSTERFFGIGNDTTQNEESNYTDVDTVAQATPGVWLLPHLNLSYRMRVRRYAIEHGQVNSIPQIEVEHPNVHGLDTAVYWAHRVAFTYDSRDEMDIPRQGALALAYTEVADEHVGSATSFVKFGCEWRNFIPLREGNPILALRLLADYVSGSADTPFWEMSSLGGRRSLRGFGSHRFVDFNRSLGTAELRTRVWQHRVFGVNAELELAPFVETGQVFHHVGDSPVSDPHWVGGLGFRGVVRPQIVGFVDIGRGSEGNAIFTGIDYPF